MSSTVYPKYVNVYAQCIQRSTQFQCMVWALVEMSHPRSGDVLPSISSDALRPAYQHPQSGERIRVWRSRSRQHSVQRLPRSSDTLLELLPSGGDDGGGCRKRRRPGRFPEPEQRWRWWTSTDNPPDRSVTRCCGPGLGLRQHACANEPLCDLGDRPIIPKLRSEVTVTLPC